MRTRVKICGFTRAEDALCAAQLGVDAVGLVFYPPSPRHVNIQQAVEIVKNLSGFVTVVALFVDEKPEQIREVLRQVPIDLLQFHGDEKPEDCSQYGKRYIKAIRVQNGIDIATFAEQFQDANGLLLDAFDPVAKGGTGIAFNWELVPKQCSLPIILAGGLDVGNAQQAVEQVRPYALDVSSGVELQKGIKDKAKMAAFLQAVRQGDENLR